MEDSKIARYFLVGLVLVFLYLTIILIRPLLTAIILAFVLSFAFYPVFKWLKKYIKSEGWASFLMVIIIVIIIFLPGAFIVNSLIKQSYATYNFVQDMDLSKFNNFLPDFVSEDADVTAYLEDIMFNLRNFMITFAPGFIGSIAQTALGLFITLFIMFYSFKDGERLVKLIEERLPMKKEYTKKLLTNTEKVTSGVLYGYILTAFVQGSLGALIFVILKIPNPIFWGFIMFILAAIPVLGTPIVWIPASLILLYNGNIFSGIFLLIFGGVVLINIDNILRPKLIGNKTKVHPGIILIGVLGGLSVFGFIGIVLGPLIITILMVLVKFLLLEFER